MAQVGKEILGNFYSRLAYIVFIILTAFSTNSAFANNCGRACKADFWLISNKAEIITELKNINVNAHPYGVTPLHFAAKLGDLEIVRLLIELGADVNFASNVSGMTPLNWAKDLVIVKYLIEHGADPARLDNNGRNAIFHAANAESLDFLVTAGANPKILDTRGQSALFSVEGYDTVEMLVKLGLDPNHLNKKGKTALHTNKDISAVKALLDLGASVAIEDFEGQTPLFKSIKDDISLTLISHGADVNHRDKEGRTPFFFATSFVKADALVKLGANPNVYDNNGRTPLQRYDACIYCFQFQVAAGADPNLLDRNGASPLHMPMYRSEHKQALLDVGANPNLRETQSGLGLTPLHTNHYRDHIIMLANAGANINARNIKGQTPLHYAARFFKSETVLTLLELGAEFATDIDGKTPWDFAQENPRLNNTDAYWKLNDLRFK